MTPKRVVNKYIRDVLAGKITVGRLVRLAVERHVWELKHCKSFVFDEKKAAAACRFFPVALRHTKGEWAGRPFELTPNQAFVVWCLFGWRRKDGTRRFRFAYITCGRKWGKSEFSAGIALMLTSFDDPLEPGADVFCSATKEDQARIVFDVGKAMVRLSPVLQDQLQVLAKAITAKPTAFQAGSSFKPVGSDSKTSDGLNVHGVVIDEIHEWIGRNHRKLYEKLTTAHGSRRQPLIVIITTAGDDHSDLWSDVDTLSIKALETFSSKEPIGENRFAFIARLDEARDCHCLGNPECQECEGSGKIPADDPFDPANWPKANPNYPVTPKHEFLQEQANDAKQTPAGRHSFERYHCNRRVSATDKAIDSVLWAKCAGELSDWDDADVVCGAWDIGGQDDLTAAGLCARFDTGNKDEDGNRIYRYEIDARGWISPEGPRDLTAAPFPELIEAGLVTVTTKDIAELKAYTVGQYTDHRVRIWAYDPAWSKDLAQMLEQEGLQPYKFFQNATQWTEPLANFLSDLRRGAIRHNGNRLLAWAADNMVMVNFSRAATALCMPDKRTSKDKIDPIVAVMMAYRCAAAAPARVRGSLYI